MIREDTKKTDRYIRFLQFFCGFRFKSEWYICESGTIESIYDKIYPMYWVLLFLVFVVVTGCSAGPGAGHPSSEGGLETDLERSAPPAPSQGEAAKISSADLVAAGRAFEAGELDKAWSLVDKESDQPEALILRARISMERGNYDAAVRFYHALTDVRGDYEPQRVIELGEALHAVGRHGEAADQIALVLATKTDQSPSRRLSLMEKRASWLLAEKKNDLAIKAYEEAYSIADRAAVKDRVNLGLGRAVITAGDLRRATKILSPLALKAERAGTMSSALRLLKKAGVEPTWDEDTLLNRARTLIARRAWSASSKALKPLLKSKNIVVREEAHWLGAQLLFKRRRHYKEAIEALEPIVRAKGAHAEEAAFLVARALSRLDRDPEAIRAYRAFAAKTKLPGKGTEARFLAARLEFYLGKHRAALRAIEQLVGRGKKKNTKSGLDAGRRRDAHFLAGMSALLAGLSSRAVPHLQAASSGTKNAEVLARNRYWFAVARLQAGKKAGADALREICSADATSWYARFAERRLADSGADIGPCQLGSLTARDKNANDKTLDELSPLAAFFARAGLFREAASELRRTEKSGTVSASTRDWVVNYIALDAPHYAVRRASRGLNWPPSSDDWWRAIAAYPSPFPDLVSEVEAQHRLPGGLIHAIARKESMFDPRAISRVGAMGMMQMMPHTYEKNRKRAELPPLTKGEIPGPERSIRAAGFEFAWLFKRFDGSMPLAIMAYNAGPAAVSRWLDRSGDLPLDVFAEKAGFAQTRNYVKRVYKNLVRYRLLASAPPPALPRIAARPKKATPDAGPAEASKGGKPAASN